MDRKLRRLGLDLIYEGERHSQFKVPKAQISIRRKSRVSASAKAKAAERMKSLHQKGGSAAAHPTVMRRYRVSGGRVAEERLEVEILK